MHENETFSVVDIMFYHGETIYNTESMLSPPIHSEHEHDEDERHSTSESKGDTRRVILYTPKFVGKESKLKALENIFGKMSATRTAHEHESRLWGTYTCAFGSKKGRNQEEYNNCTHKTDCKVMVHISTEDEWPFLIIDGIHNHGVGGAYSLVSAKKDIPKPLLDFIELYTSSPLDIKGSDIHQLTIECAHDNDFNEDVVPDVQQLKKLLDKSAASNKLGNINIREIIGNLKAVMDTLYHWQDTKEKDPNYVLTKDDRAFLNGANSFLQTLSATSSSPRVPKDRTRQLQQAKKNEHHRMTSQGIKAAQKRPAQPAQDLLGSQRHKRANIATKQKKSSPMKRLRTKGAPSQTQPSCTRDLEATRAT